LRTSYSNVVWEFAKSKLAGYVKMNHDELSGRERAMVLIYFEFTEAAANLCGGEV
jgi:hypothetical protein